MESILSAEELASLREIARGPLSTVTIAQDMLHRLAARGLIFESRMELKLTDAGEEALRDAAR